MFFISFRSNLFLPADVFIVEVQLMSCMCGLSFKGKFTKYVAQGVPVYVTTEVYAAWK